MNEQYSIINTEEIAIPPEHLKKVDYQVIDDSFIIGLFFSYEGGHPNVMFKVESEEKAILIRDTLNRHKKIKRIK